MHTGIDIIKYIITTTMFTSILFLHSYMLFSFSLENYRLDAEYETNLVIKLVLVNILLINTCNAKIIC